MFLYSAFHTKLWLLWLHDLGTYSKLHVVIVVSLNYIQNSECLNLHVGDLTQWLCCTLRAVI